MLTNIKDFLITILTFNDSNVTLIDFFTYLLLWIIILYFVKVVYDYVY